MTFRERVGFGTGVGGAGFVVPDSAAIPFADNAARDTWAAANLSDLVQNQTVVEVTGSPDNTWYLWRGPSNPPSHDNTLWIDATPLIRGPQGATGPAGALTIQEEGAPLATDATTLNFIGVGATASGAGAVKTISVPGLTVQEEGVNLLGNATTLNFTGAMITASGGADVKTIDVPGMTTENEGQEIPGGASTFNFTGVGVTATGSSGVVDVNIPGLEVQDEGVALTDNATALNFVGTGVAATGTGTTKTVTITAGGGGISGVTIQDEGTPLATAATTLNFVGVGVTATGTTDTKTISIPAAALTVQEEGVDLTTAATTLNFVGDDITASGNGAVKTISVTPTITIQDEGSPLAAGAQTLNFVGAGVTVTGTGATKTVTIPAGAAGNAVPSLHNFSIDIPQRVDIGTDLNVQHTISFDVSNYSLLTSLTLIVTDGDDLTLTNPIRDGVQTQTVTLAGTNTGAATTITLQLSGAYSGGTVTSNIQTVNVANAQAQEQGYFGARTTNDFATVPLNELTAFDVTQAGTVFTITQSVPNGDVFGVILPNNRNAVSMVNTSLNIDELSSFTLTTDIRTIGGISADSLTVQNNSGFTSTFEYRLTTE